MKKWVEDILNDVGRDSEIKSDGQCSGRKLISDDEYNNFLQNAREIITLWDEEELSPGEAFDVIRELASSIVEKRLGF